MFYWERPGDVSSGRGATVELPEAAHVEVTSVCNQRCRMCYNTFVGRPPVYLDVEEFGRFVESAGSISRYHLQGIGEPLVHPRFWDIVGLLRRKQVSLTTNGTRLDSRTVDRLESFGVSRVVVSFDSADPGRYRRVRGTNHFRTVVANLENLLSRKSRTPSSAVNIVYDPGAAEDIASTIRFLTAIGPPQELCVIAEQYTAFLDHKETLSRLAPDRVTREEVERALGEALNEASRAGVQVDVLAPSASVTMPAACLWPWNAVYVHADLSIGPCCTLVDVKYGSLRDDTLDRIWLSEGFQGLRRCLTEGPPSAECRRCNFFE